MKKNIRITTISILVCFLLAAIIVSLYFGGALGNHKEKQPIKAWIK